MPEQFPTPSFNFRVEFDIDGITDNSSSFQELSDLTNESNPITYREGGANHYTYKLPGGAGFANLVLKKGFISDDKIYQWLNNFSAGNKFEKHDIKITLVNETGSPEMTWKIINAFPANYKLTGFEEDKGRIAVEKLELAFESMEREL